MPASSVNHLVIESLDDRTVIQAARELERQYCADAPVAHDIAEIASRHEQDEIAGVRPRAFDTLSEPARAAFIAHAKIGLRLNRPAWRAVQHARMQLAAQVALEEFASQWIPQDRMEMLAHYVTSRIATAGRYALDELADKPMPREFAAALQMVQRRGER